MWVYVLAMGAAFLFAAGSVTQQRVASEAPPERTLSIGLLLWLVRRKVWLAGTACSLVGNVLGAAALSQGGVALVQPLLNVRLLFALGFVAVLSRVALTRRDWGGAVAAAVGLGLFVVVGRPSAGNALDVPTFRWVWALLGVAALTSVLFLTARRLGPPAEATLLGAAAGVLFASQSSLTEVATHIFAQHGLLGLLVRWQPYLVVVAALTGAVLIQSAYEMAPLTASYPALTTTEPLVGVAIGIGVLRGTLHASVGAIAAEVAGLGIMTLGVYLLATSPLITGQVEALRRRRDEGMAFRTAAELERDLSALHRDMERFRERPERRRERVAEHLRCAEREMTRLSELQREMERYRVAEREHVEQLEPKERMLLEPLEEELDQRSAEIEATAERLERDLETVRRELAP